MVGRGLPDSRNRIQRNGTPRLLKLKPGSGTEHFQIEALSPPTHPFRVRIESLSNTDLRVRLHTTDGSDLRVTESTRTDSSCRAINNQRVCSFLFPTLEARSGGIWDVYVEKASPESATVKVTVNFQ